MKTTVIRITALHKKLNCVFYYFAFGSHRSSKYTFLHLLAVLHIGKANKIHRINDTYGGNGMAGVIYLLKSDYIE